MLVAVDLETTGLDAKKDKIIEIALVKFDPDTFEILEEFSSLIDPEIHIPELNSSITHIYDEDVRGAPKWGEILQKVSDFIGDCPVLGHNVYFDTGFLEAKGISLDNTIILDTFLIANFLVLGEKSLSLEYLSKYFEINLVGAHRALNDTKATIILFKKLIKKLIKLASYKKKILFHILQKSEDSGMKYLAKKYFVDIESFESDESFIKGFSKVLPKKKKYETIEIQKELGVFNFKNALANTQSLEIRENQKKMADIVYDNIESQKLSAIEAPTGIGKTFAYLLPAIFHSINTGEQVFVSTSTKALQDQIFYKDLKLLQEQGNMKFSYAKLKGKKNYVGIQSFLNFLEDDSDYSAVRTSFILKIILWLSITASGELDELDYYGQEFSFLYEVNADDLLTFSTDNNYNEIEFAVRARRQAKTTNIVIINNNILFQDIDGENSILSKVENLIIDEAHNLEDVLTQSLQKTFCMEDLEKNLLKIEKKLFSEKQKTSEISIKREKLVFELALAFDIFNVYLGRKVPSSSKYRIHLIKKDFFEQEGKEMGENNILSTVQMLFIDYIDSLQQLEDTIYNKLSREVSYIENCMDIFSKALSQKSIQKYICFLNFSERKGLQIEYTYLNPGEYLQKKLWKNVSSCVLTSATLTSGDDFSYSKNMLHLDDFHFHKLDTDFDYAKQALLFIPDDIGSVKNNFLNVIQFLYEFMKVVKGNTLVLFTSFYSIKETYTSLERDLKNEGINVYAQSIGGGKQKLIDFYKQNSHNSVLIGTNTFWEGVDIPGEKLKYLIIHKIPFMVPTDPIFQARGLLFSDSFSEYAVPKAVIKLKQGFGRLIRTKNDSGIVVFLDDRIYSTAWGQALYGAFPQDIKKKIGSKKDFIEVLSLSCK